MRVLLLLIGLGVAGLAGSPLAPEARAQNLERFIEGAILHREDARRYEERAHREHRPEEERYWHSYGEGMERHGEHR